MSTTWYIVAVLVISLSHENLRISSHQQKMLKISHKVNSNIKTMIKLLHKTAVSVATSATLLSRKDVMASESKSNLLEDSAINRIEATFRNVNGTAEFIEKYCRDFLSLARMSGM